MRRKPRPDTVVPGANSRHGTTHPTAGPPRDRPRFRAADAAARPLPQRKGRELDQRRMTHAAVRHGCSSRPHRRCAKQRHDEHRGEHALAVCVV